MTKAEIKDQFIGFNDKNLINMSEIKSIDDMQHARTFCSVMRVGIFSNVSTEDMFEALQECVSEGKFH